MSAGLARYLKKECDVRCGRPEFTVRCLVRDVRTTGGHIDFLVSPIAGEGSAWVRFSRITFDEPSLNQQEAT